MLGVLFCGTFCCTQSAVVSDPRLANGDKNVAPGQPDVQPTVVVDYERGITGIHDVEAARCYLIATVPEAVPEVSEVKQNIGEHVDDPEAVPEYRLTEDDLVEDRTLLPASLREGCSGLPLYWVEPSGEERADTRDTRLVQVPLRWCRRVCVFGRCKTICVGK